MFAWFIVIVFFTVLGIIVYREYKNEKAYQEKRSQKYQRKPKQTKTVEEKTILLPEANYPKFNHSRLIKMGLSQEDAQEFVGELISQIETQLPSIKEAMDIADFQSMEQLTHSIKGSATNIGVGGVSDLLVDFNTYLKSGKELAIIETYLNHLNHYHQELKRQY